MKKLIPVCVTLACVLFLVGSGDSLVCEHTRQNDMDRTCSKSCSSDTDCRASTRQCLCDGKCGSACINPDLSCSPEVPEIAHGRVTVAPSNKFNAIAIYSCEPEYTLVGLTARVCQGDRTWMGDPPRCVLSSILSETNKCGPPPRIPHATHSGPPDQIKFAVGESLIYSCLNGFSHISEEGEDRATCGKRGKWVGPKLTCNIIYCNILNDPLHGAITLSDTSYGSVVRFLCDVGYNLVGSAERTCQANGTWSGEDARCEEIICPFLNRSITNGSVHLPYSSFAVCPSYMTIAQYTCDNGYILMGLPSRICQSDGTWTGDEPTCDVNIKTNDEGAVCGSPPIFPNMEHNGSPESPFNFSASTTLTYFCNPGFSKHEGSKDSVVCDTSGKWVGPNMTCIKIECRKLERPLHGSMTGSNPSMVRFVCDVGYTLFGSAERTCQSDNTWSGQETTCEELNCAPLEPVYNGYLDGNLTTFGSVVFFRCTNGTGLVGPTSSTRCLETGEWSHPVPACLPQCQVPAIMHATLTGGQEREWVDHGSVIQVTCDLGYLINYQPPITCENETWSFIPKCLSGKAQKCGPPPHIPQATYNVRPTKTRFTVGNVMNYTCIPGYTPEPNSVASAFCVEGGVWVGPKLICTAIHCEEQQDPAHGKRIGSGNTYGSVVRFVCDIGYKLKGPQQQQCQGDGSWKENVPKCEKIVCPSLSKITGGNVSATDGNNVGSIVTCTCQPGYVMTGYSTIICMHDGRWSGLWPYCERLVLDKNSVCGIPPSSQHAFPNIDYNKLAFSSGSIITYTCSPGFVKAKQSEYKAKCDNSRIWVGLNITCNILRCNVPPKLLNGDNILANNNYGSSIRSYCNENYWLIGATEQLCLSKKSWDVSQPVCTEITCSKLQPPYNGFLEGNGSTSGKIFFRCNDRTTMVGPANSTRCLQKGRWSHPSPLCLGQCQVPQIINATFIGDQEEEWKEHGYTLEPKCIEGFAVNDTRDVTCENGTWSIIPECVPAPCGPPPLIDNGHINTSYLAHGDTAEYTCDKGYKAVNNEQYLTCQYGQWTGPIPQCVNRRCQIPAIKKSTKLITLKGLTVDEFRTLPVQCDLGFAVNDTRPVTCQDGAWSLIPACVPGCSGLELTRQNEIYPWGSVFKFRCPRTYALMGDTETTCLINGSWSSHKYKCLLLGCKELKSPINGRKLRTTNIFADENLFFCNEGFKLVGSNLRRCMSNQSWNGEEAVCEAQCQIPTIQNASIPCAEGKSWMDNSTTVYPKCDEGLVLNDTRKMTCVNGNWSFIPSCVNGGETRVCEQERQVDNSRTCLKSCDTDKDCDTEIDRCLCDGTCGKSCVNPAVQCNPVPTNITHGMVRVHPDNRFGAIASYSCEAEYTITGLWDRVCNGEGSWFGEVPRCELDSCPDAKKQECGPPPQIHLAVHNAPANQTKFELGSVVYYMCLPGFDPSYSGVPFATCNYNGKWWGPHTTCSDTYCVPLIEPKNSYRIGSKTNYGSVARFICNIGYEMVGSAERMCQIDSKWSGDSNKCEEITCLPEPVNITNGSVTVYPYNRYQAIARYRCDNGYTLVGPSARICQADKTWLGDAPICVYTDLMIDKTKECGLPPQAHNAMHDGPPSQTNFSLGTKLSYSCLPGYSQQNHVTWSVCDEFGNWSEVHIECAIIRCKEPDKLNNGTIEFTYSSVIRYACHIGYSLVGSTERTCQANGTWSGDDVTCQVLDCGPPNPIINGYMEGNLTTMGAVIFFRCNYRTTLVGSEIATRCLENGQWTGSQSSCRADCQNPSNNGEPGTWVPHGSKMSFMCPAGSVRDDIEESMCDDGNWTIIPTCVVPTCVEPPQVELGYREFSSQVNGSVAYYSCIEDLSVEMNKWTLTCVDGEWQGDIHKCEHNGKYQCGFPPIVPNAINMLNPMMTKFDMDTSLTYKCVEGYMQLNNVGPTIATCDKTGNWIAPTMTCHPTTCKSLEPPQNGNMTSTNNTYGSVVRFFCDLGYELVGSRQRVCQSDGEWSGYNVTCEEINCGSPGIIHNGYLEGTLTNVMSVYFYKCNNRTTFVGPDEMTRCLENEEWSHPPPLCLGQCQVPAIKNATITGRQEGEWMDHGSSIEVTCDSPLKSSDRQPVICNNGTWSIIPACTYESCDQPPEIENGYSISHHVHGSKASYYCRRGYKMVNSTRHLICEHGNWTGSTPVCERGSDSGQCDDDVEVVKVYDIISTCKEGTCWRNLTNMVCVCDGECGKSCNDKNKLCPAPADLEHGKVIVPPIKRFETIASYTCDTSYQLTGLPARVCQSDGTWSGDAPTCFKKAVFLETDQICGPPPNVLQATYTGFPYRSTFRLGTRLTYTCLPGYYTDNDSNNTAVCVDGGQWMRPEMTCRDIFCTKLNRPLHGNMFGSNTLYGSVITFTCDIGYKLLGSSWRTCQANGNWSGFHTKCEEIFCELLKPIQHSLLIGESTRFGAVSVYVCVHRYTLFAHFETNATTQCLKSGEWSQRAPACLGQCQVPAIANATIMNAKEEEWKDHGVSLEIVCANDKIRSDTRPVTCVNGTWSNIPTCMTPHCDVPPWSENGHREYSGVKSGSKANYSCNEDLSLVSHKWQLTCQNGKWTGDIHRCERNDKIYECRFPPQIPHAVHDRLPNKTRYLTLSSLTYSCLPGYTLDNNSHPVSNCVDNGTWTAPVMTCIITQCETLEPPLHGNKTGSNTAYGSVIRFTCDIRYKFVGSAERTCQSNSTWSGQAATCEEIICDPPQTYYNGYLEGNLNTVGSVYYFRCNNRTTFVGPDTSTRCLETGKWSHPTPICLGQCQVPDIKNATITGGQVGEWVDHGFIIEANCDTLFILSDPRPVTCENGTWSTIPSCIYEPCDQPPQIENGYSEFDHAHGSRASYHCLTGYKMANNNRYLTCEHGNWKGSTPICKTSGVFDKVQCEYTRDKNAIGCQESCNYHSDCTKKYKNSTCLCDGLCGRSCIDVSRRCPQLQDNITDTMVYISISNRYESRTLYRCEIGYRLVGLPIRVCQSDGTWTGHEFPRCVNTPVPIDSCDQPPEIENGYSIFQQIQGSVVKYLCFSGFQMVNNSYNLICEDGKWKGSTPTCERIATTGECEFTRPFDDTGCNWMCVQDSHCWHGNIKALCLCDRLCEKSCIDFSSPGKICPTPAKIEHGTVVTPPVNRYESVIKYSCDEGYKLMGLPVRVCQSDGTWHGEAPRCEMKNADADSCGLPPQIDNGYHVFSHAHGSTATYFCVSGYYIFSNSRTLICDHGSWKGSTPICELPPLCPDPEEIEHGHIDVPEVKRFQSMANYSCVGHYYLVGLRTRVCQIDGTWLGQIPKCKPTYYGVPCPEPANIPHGKVDYPARSIEDSMATYSCIDGYILVGPPARMCQKDGHWTGAFPRCEHKDYLSAHTKEICPPPPTIRNGRFVVPTIKSLNSMANYTCDDHYGLITLPTLVCQSDGRWQGDIPICLPIGYLIPYLCYRPENIENGKVDYHFPVTEGNAANYRCDDGYKLVGLPTILCVYPGIWLGQKPSCAPHYFAKICPVPENLERGRVAAPASNSFESMTNYSCDIGYKLVGLPTRVCQSNGTWSGETPRCELKYYFSDMNKTCLASPNAQHATHSGSPTAIRFSLGTKLTYTCIPGYATDQDSNNIAECVDGGYWMGPNMTCTTTHCTTLNQPLNGDMRGSNTIYGSVNRFTCNIGYRLVGSAERACQANGTWSGEDATCKVIHCGNINPIPNPPIDAQVTNVGTIIVNSCGTRRTLFGSEAATQCMETGEWSQPTPVCLAQCQIPFIKDATITNGQVGEWKDHGDSLKIVCDVINHALSDSRMVTCVDGNWSIIPTCLPVTHCNELESPMHGRIHRTTPSYANIISITCDLGFLLIGSADRECQADGTWSGSDAVCEGNRNNWDLL